MPENRALVTGAQGFCGRYLVDHLLGDGWEVTGIDQRAGLGSAVRLLVGDIRDRAWVRSVLEESRPTHVFHLAALTSARADWHELFEANVRGTGELLRAVEESGLAPGLLLTGSSACYGAVAPEELPIRESQPFRPATAYAASKIAQEMLAFALCARLGLRLVRARAFNLTGPGESPGFVTSAFARQVAEIEAGQREPVLEVGNLEAVRDFTDVRDAVRAYVLLAERGEAGGVYNVCSGVGVSIRSVLGGLLALSSACGVRVEVASERFQAADVPVQVGDASRLEACTGWRTRIPLERSLRDVLERWRAVIRQD